MKIINNKKIKQKPSQMVSCCYLELLVCVSRWANAVCTKVQPEYLEVHHSAATFMGCAAE